MHPHFEFPVRQVLWTLTFAAQLVLLVVLLGRARARRYPCFTAGIALFTLQLMAEVLLAGRMAIIPLQEILLTLADLGVILALLVVVEVARRAFAGAQRFWWTVSTLGLLVVLFGRHFKAGWRSHTQMISIGLSAIAISWLAVQAVVQSIVKTAHPQSREEYERILDLIAKLLNASKLVFLVALVWWIVWLWLDEPG